MPRIGYTHSLETRQKMSKSRHDKRIPAVGFKICKRCDKEKVLDAFYPAKRSKFGRRNICTDCRKEIRAAWKSSVPNTNLHLFHISPEQYLAMLATQDFCCAICKTDTPHGRGCWNIDHDHACCPGVGSCGKCIRGLICHHCNVALSRAFDSVEILSAMISYLKAWQERLANVKITEQESAHEHIALPQQTVALPINSSPRA